MEVVLLSKFILVDFLDLFIELFMDKQSHIYMIEISIDETFILIQYTLLALG